MNNNQVMNFNNKLSSALVSCSASDVLNNVEQRILANIYTNSFNRFYGYNNHIAQVYYVNDPNFRAYLNSQIYTHFYQQMSIELNKKAQEINNRIYRVIMNINNYLYS